jgi:hexosaminidase
MRRLSFLILGLLLCMVSCNKSGQVSKTEAQKIAVSWKLISNYIEPAGSFDAKFTITNGSNFDLSNKNWALFFSMMPRPILPNKTAQPATVEHINGDWYKLVPAEDFKLTAGDSIVINYSGTEGIIKETDAPAGLYFVFYDESGNEKEIVQVDAFKIEPFLAKEQILRGPMDMSEVPTSETRFKENEVLSLINPDQLLKIIPTPYKMAVQAGTYQLDAQTSIYFENGLENEAKYLAQKLQELTGKQFATKLGTATAAAIQLQKGAISVNGVAQEAYQLNISDKGVAIKGNDASGVFYGVQSLVQLIPAEAYFKKAEVVALPFIAIEDAPRFKFRSMHLDVARNFQSKETVKRIIDLLSMYKVNHMLLYTADDEGWRVEIDGLPELTSVGGKRGHVAGMNAPALPPAYGSGPDANDPTKTGSGFYTRAEFIEILKYANERHIKIIPEMNMPGHALAAIKSMEARYERLMKEGKEVEANEYRLIDPDDQSTYLSAQAYKNNVVSVGRESVYHFIEKVVDEYDKIYKEAGLKMDIFHMGGDEVAEGVWEKSPLAAKVLKDNPQIQGAKNLQAHFFRTLLPRLEKRNLIVHGWEEVALMKSPDNVYVPNPEFAKRPVIPYIWNNLFDVDLGNKLANAGYQVVLCNVTNFYFDMSYNHEPTEPGLYWGGFVNAWDNWYFAPFDMFRTTEENAMGKVLKEEFVGKELLKPEARKNIIGIEAQLWCEAIHGRDQLEYMILPKLMGFSESGWGKERKWENIADKNARLKVAKAEWNLFANTIARKDLPKLKHVNGGYNYRLPIPGAVIKEGYLHANSELPGLEIRYTTDGTEPTKNSPLYSKPVQVSGSVKVKGFDVTGMSSRSGIVVVR